MSCLYRESSGSTKRQPLARHWEVNVAVASLDKSEAGTSDQWSSLNLYFEVQKPDPSMTKSFYSLGANHSVVCSLGQIVIYAEV